jgi:hypothetical protein
VTPTITKNGNVSKVVYTPSPILPANSSVTAVVSFSDGANQYNGTNTFTVGGGVTIPPSVALKASDVDKTKSGFLIKTWQVAMTNNAATSANNPGNSTQIGEIYAHQWWGWPNVASLSAFTGPGGSYVETGTINYNGSTGATGTFGDDVQMPGIRNDNPDLPESGTDFYALEIRTVLDLQPGTYEMGVNSDDGFRVIVGDGKDALTLPLVAGEFSGGRGTDNFGFTRFSVQVTQAGLYPFRLVFEEGTGGNSVEWFTVTKDWYPDQLNKVLINDSANGGIKAYQYPINSTGPTYVKTFTPGNSSSDSAASVGRAGPDATVSAVIVDGSTPANRSPRRALCPIPVVLT